MNDDEMDELIAILRAMLIRNGFGYVAEEAEEGLYPTAGRRARALALIEAAEGVTVDLADIELRGLDRLESEEIVFQRDDEDQAGDYTRAQDARGGPEAGVSGSDRLRGPQRYAHVADLASRRAVFRQLRKRLDGED